jgi:hypothetical protein
VKVRQLVLGLALFACFYSAKPVEARWGVAIGVGFGVPCYPRPWVYAPGPYYYGPYGPYAYPYPIYYPPPVVVQPAPAVVQPAPVGSQPVSVTPVQTTSARTGIDVYLDQLRSGDDATRQNAAMELGRARAERGVDALTATLAGDRSPAVREAAAKGLGLIGSSRGLTALTRASSADPDRDVRHSAQFAVEVIRTNLRKD